MTTKAGAMTGVGKRHGSASREFQRLIRANCERGDTQNATKAVAAVLLSEGERAALIPTPTGVKTNELLARAEEAIKHVASEYHMRGGVLTAKGYVPRLGLVAEMAKQWLEGFSPPIQTSVDLRDGLLEEELNARLALTAQAVLEELVEVCHNHGRDEVLAMIAEPYEGGVVEIYSDKIEGFCMKAARKMFEAFQNPNEIAHKKAHGVTP